MPKWNREELSKMMLLSTFGLRPIGKMTKLDFQHTLLTFSTVINQFCIEGNISQAVRLGFISSGDIDGTAKLLKMLEERGLNPNVITYNIVIDSLSLCKKGLLTEVFTIVVYLWQNGTLSEMMLLSTSGLMPIAFRLIGEMIETRKVPNINVYTTLIKGFHIIEDIDGAIKLLKMLEESGHNPNVITYNIIIDSLYKKGLLTQGLTLLSK
ncbi:hypothetical protein GOBAR_DD09575 [Gossypium barbadense]|nr:hypothetical protein GOBAR_DD09575 [Gossypium barbadense]